MQKNPCLSVECIYNRRNNVFILSFLMGIENDSGYAFMRLRVSGWAGNKRIAHE